MDEVSLFSQIFSLFSQNRPLDARLTSVLAYVREELELDAAEIQLIRSDSEEIFSYGDASTDFGAEIRSQVFSTPMRDCDCAFGTISIGHHADCQRYWSLIGAHPREIFEIRFAVGGGMSAELQLVRAVAHGGFDAGLLETALALALYLRIGIHQSLRNFRQHGFSDSAERIFERFHIGVLTINQQFDILARSALAEALLDGCSCLAIRDGKLEPLTPTVQNSFMQFLHELADCDSGVYRFLDSGVTEDSAIVAISRCNDGGIEAQLRGVQYNVFIFSAEQESIAVDAAADIWHISVAERRILLAMMRYDNAKKVAIELNVSVNTVKAQLKSAYRKMGIVSKAMLVRRLYSARNLEALIDVS